MEVHRLLWERRLADPRQSCGPMPHLDAQPTPRRDRGSPPAPRPPRLSRNTRRPATRPCIQPALRGLAHLKVVVRGTCAGDFSLAPSETRGFQAVMTARLLAPRAEKLKPPTIARCTGDIWRAKPDSTEHRAWFYPRPNVIVRSAADHRRAPIPIPVDSWNRQVFFTAVHARSIGCQRRGNRNRGLEEG